uniref:Uncharacterized protein n=1 Tax=Timema genevievae TaxID=629358 RepID=A0A7R9PPC4_TIMGE|nr:unnamed protein product [Timema genevievae]
MILHSPSTKSFSYSILILPPSGVPWDLSNLVEVGLNPSRNRVRCGREIGDWSASSEQGLASWLGVGGLIDWSASLEQGLASWLGVGGLIDWSASSEQGLARELYTSDKTGDDATGDGSDTKPYKTILRAMQHAGKEPFPIINDRL